MGLKSHQMDVVTPARGRGIPKACTGEKGGHFHQRHFGKPGPRGVLPSHHDVGPGRPLTIVWSLDVIQLGFWHEDGLVGTCGSF
jgi:hypothetical protein